MFIGEKLGRVLNLSTILSYNDADIMTLVILIIKAIVFILKNQVAYLL